MNPKSFIPILFFFALCSCGEDDSGKDAATNYFTIVSAAVGSVELTEGQLTEGIPVEQTTTISVTFSQAVDAEALKSAISLKQGTAEMDFTLDQLSVADFELELSQKLRSGTTYTLAISRELAAQDGASFAGVTYPFSTENQSFELISVAYGTKEGLGQDRIMDVPLTLDLTLTFSASVDFASLSSALSIGSNYPLSLEEVSSNTAAVVSESTLPELSRFVLSISEHLAGANGESFAGYAQEFYTKLDSTLKFPEISDEELLTKVQQQTFGYFWDFAHPTSGLARERNTSNETVTSGGSGFGLMAILVGIERGFITREEGIDRLDQMVAFLHDDADRFHGAFSHWLNGSTGDVIPFSSDDDGGDLVETALMMQGLLTVRQYLDVSDEQEAGIINRINTLWEEVEWDWYTQNDQEVLYWHWSPNYDWQKDHRITGWNEALIVYVLAAASPTHAIDQEVYTQGWSRSGAMVNSSNASYYGYTLDLRTDMGGPLFFAHYSFLGLDPRNLSDQYANYWDQNVNHSLINHAYCSANPQGYVGYKEYCWGLTASDNPDGYSAHSPDNDLGVITPTAALSSMPYTPEVSMKALRHFYYILGDDLWGPYGFYDAFDLTEKWTASSYLAIDQGPILIMIENHRSGLLWDLFMSAPEVQNGLEKLGFTYE